MECESQLEDPFKLYKKSSEPRRVWFRRGAYQQREPCVLISLLHMRAGLLLLTVCALQAENWPQWRGPDLDGISHETNLPAHWNPNDNIAWRLPMPDRSGSTPIIWGNYTFLNFADPV